MNAVVKREDGGGVAELIARNQIGGHKDKITTAAALALGEAVFGDMSPIAAAMLLRPVQFGGATQIVLTAAGHATLLRIHGGEMTVEVEGEELIPARGDPAEKDWLKIRAVVRVTLKGAELPPVIKTWAAAVRAGFIGGKNPLWSRQPPEMLVAWAKREAVRRAIPDRMGYFVDEDGIEVSRRQSGRISDPIEDEPESAPAQIEAEDDYTSDLRRAMAGERVPGLLSGLRTEAGFDAAVERIGADAAVTLLGRLETGVLELVVPHVEAVLAGGEPPKNFWAAYRMASAAGLAAAVGADKAIALAECAP